LLLRDYEPPVLDAYLSLIEKTELEKGSIHRKSLPSEVILPRSCEQSSTDIIPTSSSSEDGLHLFKSKERLMW